MSSQSHGLPEGVETWTVPRYELDVISQRVPVATDTRKVIDLSDLSKIEAASEASSELRSLRRELATLLGPIEKRSGVDDNEQWIAKVAALLDRAEKAEADQAYLDALHAAGLLNAEEVEPDLGEIVTVLMGHFGELREEVERLEGELVHCRSKVVGELREALISELESGGWNADGDIPGEEVGRALDRVVERISLGPYTEEGGGGIGAGAATKEAGRLPAGAGAVSTPSADPASSHTEQGATAGLPPELVQALRDPTIVVDADHKCILADGRTLAEHLEEWRNAPSNTVSGGLSYTEQPGQEDEIATLLGAQDGIGKKQPGQPENSGQDRMQTSLATVLQHFESEAESADELQEQHAPGSESSVRLCAQRDTYRYVLKQIRSAHPEQPKGEEGKPKRHELKCWPPYFEHVLLGEKTFEIRSVADRSFAAGDSLLLREFDGSLLHREPATEGYTGRSCKRRITYVLGDGDFGVKEGYVVLGLAAQPDTPAEEGEPSEQIDTGEPFEDGGEDAAQAAEDTAGEGR